MRVHFDILKCAHKLFILTGTFLEISITKHKSGAWIDLACSLTFQWNIMLRNFWPQRQSWKKGKWQWELLQVNKWLVSMPDSVVLSMVTSLQNFLHLKTKIRNFSLFHFLTSFTWTQPHAWKTDTQLWKYLETGKRHRQNIETCAKQQFMWVPEKCRYGGATTRLMCVIALLCFFHSVGTKKSLQDL